MESEFIALDKVGEEAEWLQNFLEDILYWPKPVAPVCIHCDSQAAIGKAGSMMCNDYVKSKDNVSDPLTKGLSREGVERTSKGMGLRPRTSQHGEQLHCFGNVALLQNWCTIFCYLTELMHWLNKQMQPFSKRHTDSWKDMTVQERMQSLMNRHEFIAKVVFVRGLADSNTPPGRNHFLKDSLENELSQRYQTRSVKDELKESLLDFDFMALRDFEISIVKSTRTQLLE
ncbi:hypothetical protein BC332_26561 [Capsicum chinense]|nr:hypothetical protein BC332_26561 [Capsicum chinense]